MTKLYFWKCIDAKCIHYLRTEMNQIQCSFFKYEKNSFWKNALKMLQKLEASKSDASKFETKCWNESNSMHFLRNEKQLLKQCIPIFFYHFPILLLFLYCSHKNKIEQFLWSSTHMSNRISGASWRTRRSIILSIVMTRYRPVFSHFSF